MTFSFSRVKPTFFAFAAFAVLCVSGALTTASAQQCITQWAPDLPEGKAFSTSKVVIIPATSSWSANSSKDIESASNGFTKLLESTAKRVGFEQVFPDYTGQDGLRIAKSLQTLRAEVLGTFGEFFIYNSTGYNKIVRQTMPLAHPVHPEYNWLADKLGTNYVMFSRASQYSDTRHVLVTVIVDLKSSEVVARNIVTTGKEGHKHLNLFTDLSLSEIATKSR